MFNPTRNGMRVDCGDKCLLHLNSQRYPCTLENLSFSGALVRGQHLPLSTVQPGDRCGLLLCSDPAICPTEYTTKVTRVSTTEIALQFLEVRFK